MSANLIHKLIVVFLALITAIAISNLVLNALIYKKQRDNDSNHPDAENITESTTPSTIQTESTATITTTRTPSTNPLFKEAADILKQGIDPSYDPCEDFYMFTCGSYLKNSVIPPGAGRIGTYDETQRNVNLVIAQRLSNTTTDALTSVTEKLLQKIFNSCMKYKDSPGSPETRARTLLKELEQKFNTSLPMITTNWNEMSDDDLWRAVGLIEREYALPTLLQSSVSVDPKNIDFNTLLINQILLNMARDYYVKPQYLDDYLDYVEKLKGATLQFFHDMTYTTFNDSINQGVEDAAKLEKTLALASLADEQLRNFQEQYNSYTLADLNKAYPAINWDAYLTTILNKEILPADHFIIQQQSYVAALNSYLASAPSKKDVINLLLIRVVVDNADFLSSGTNDAYKILSKKIKEMNVKEDVWTENAYGCVSVTLVYMPYANGYTYLQTISSTVRDAVRKDITQQMTYVVDEFLQMIKSLNWLSGVSFTNAKNKADNLIKNYGWPDDLYGDFKDSTNLDNYHRAYQANIPLDGTDDWFTIMNAVKKSFQITENFDQYNKRANRKNFLESPAFVNAWYQPERNSITIPFATLNPPYYKYGFPQAYNYAGQGGTSGHELTHGYDDEGVQFGPKGALSGCTWNHCGWMDRNSSSGFIDMAQCVVTQFSQNCCPLKTGNVHCTSGERTQGENIADLGGQLAAYNAYRRYVRDVRNNVEEDALPGLEQYTPNQIFWIAYGYSWCMNYTDASLRAQLMTNPHAPGSCRVNEVLRDIPEFAIDFKCRRGSYMYPDDNQRCHVWRQ